MANLPQSRRNAELFIRHCVGDSYAALASAYGISRARAGEIGKLAAERLVCGLPITIETSRETYGIWKRRSAA